MHTTGRAAATQAQQQGEKEEDDLSGPPSSFLPLPDPRAHTPSRSQQELEALGVVLQVCSWCFACWAGVVATDSAGVCATHLRTILFHERMYAQTKQDIHRRSGAYREGLVQARAEGAALLEAAIKVCWTFGCTCFMCIGWAGLA